MGDWQGAVARFLSLAPTPAPERGLVPEITPKRGVLVVVVVVVVVKDVVVMTEMSAAGGK